MTPTTPSPPATADSVARLAVLLPSLDDRLRWALREDLGEGDLTGEAVFGAEGGREVTALLRAKEAGVVCGLGVAERVFALVDDTARVERTAGVADGAEIATGTVLLRVRGRARSLLAAERTALNLLQRASGIATATRAFVGAAVGSRARILDTRKTMPLWRDLDKAAVAAGGGTNHRLGLWDAYMIKDNHIDALGGIEAALARVAAHRAARGGGRGRPEVVVEVRDLGELERALRAPDAPDVVMLDNMRGAELRRAAERVAAAAGVASEVSGGVRLESVAAIAALGVDRISVGALTHSVRGLDISMRLAGGGE